MELEGNEMEFGVGSGCEILEGLEGFEDCRLGLEIINVGLECRLLVGSGHPGIDSGGLWVRVLSGCLVVGCWSRGIEGSLVIWLVLIVLVHEDL